MSTGSEFQDAAAAWSSGENPDRVVQALCSALTHEEKLGMFDGEVEFWEGRMRALTHGQSNQTFPAAQVARLGVPGFEFVDGPRGVGLGEATCFPVSMARGASFDAALEAEIGEAIGRELRVRGGTLFGGVCVNLLRMPPGGERRLVGFARLSLQAGETGSQTISLDLSQLCVRHGGPWSWEDRHIKLEAGRWSGDPEAVGWTGRLDRPIH